MNTPMMSHAVLVTSLEAMTDHNPIGRSSRDAGVMTVVAGVGHPNFNVAVAQTNSIGREALRASLDELADTGLPYAALFPASVGPALGDVLEDHGMAREDDTIPLMTALSPSGVPWPDDLTVDTSPAALDIHRQMMVDIFDLGHDVVDPIVSHGLWNDDEVFTVVGMDGETPVTTALSVKRGTSIGVFNVGTHPDYRGRGYGAAATAHVTDEAFRAGGTVATLQSSPIGYSVYESLGFKKVLDQERWTSAANGSRSTVDR